MRRTGNSLQIAAGILALVLGVPGLLLPGCAACAFSAAQAGPECHESARPALHSACCGGSSVMAPCCGEMKEPVTLPGTQTAAALTAPSSAPLVQATAVVARMHETLARPVRPADAPLLYEGTGLYTLHSVLLI